MKRFLSIVIACLVGVSTLLPSVPVKAAEITIGTDIKNKDMKEIDKYSLYIFSTVDDTAEVTIMARSTEKDPYKKFSVDALSDIPCTEKIPIKVEITLCYKEGYLYLYGTPYNAKGKACECSGGTELITEDFEGHKQTESLVQLRYWQYVINQVGNTDTVFRKSEGKKYVKCTAEDLLREAYNNPNKVGIGLYGDKDSTVRTNWHKEYKYGRKKVLVYAPIIQEVVGSIYIAGGVTGSSYADLAKEVESSTLNDFLKAAIGAKEKEKTENASNESGSAADAVGDTKAEDATFEVWCKAIVALYSNKSIKDKDAYKDPNTLLYAGLTDYEKLSILALAQSYPKGDNDLSAYQSISMESSDEWKNLLDNSTYTDIQKTDSQEYLNASNIIENYSKTGAADCYDFMYTSYARAVYWKSRATSDTSGGYADLYENYAERGKETFYLSSETSNISTETYLAIKDFEAFTHYIEISQEMAAYVQTSLPVLKEAKNKGEDLTAWHKALAQLKACVEYMNLQSMHDLWDNEFQSLYNELDSMLNDTSGEIGDMSDASAELQAGDPLQMFFANLDEEVLSDDMIMGIAYSSAFVPMRTNMYDPHTVKDWDDEFLYNFHYRYGYYRKALYKADASDAAQSLANTELVGTKSVCTLKDLIDPAGDVVLYLDDNFYNIDKLAELLDKSYDRISASGDYKVDTDGDGEEDSVIDKWWTYLTNNVSELLDTDVASQVKTDDNTQYSQKLRNRVSSQKNSDYLPDAYIYDESNSAKDEYADNSDHTVLTSGQINTYLTMSAMEQRPDGSAAEVYDGYNVLQPYSVVSAVYRSATLFRIANSSEVRDPVFIASYTVPNTGNASDWERNEIFNWLLLKNLESQMPIGYNTSLDMEAPVYMDVYGNIVTESGTVVIPAASNATLFSDSYKTYGDNMGLLYVYGKDYSLKDEDVSSELNATLTDRMEVDTYLNAWKMKSTVYSYSGDIGTLMDTARISIADEDVKRLMQNSFYKYLYANVTTDTVESISGDTAGYDFYKYAGIVLEVMRGAPIESIDKDFENLNTARTMTNAGLSAAAKLEVLDNSLAENGANSLLALPNLAFVDGFEYIALFTFKVLMLIVTLVLMFTLYRDMVGQSLSLQTLFKCISLVVITCLAVVTVPEAFNISYYQANRMLLQDETEYIAMLNEEKRQNGVEIGVTSIEEPDTSTRLLLKLDDLDVPWYDLFQKVMLSNTYKGLDEVYASFAEDSPISQQEDVTVMNDGVYVYVDDLFDSASIDIDDETGVLNLRTNEVTTAAFYTPYYVILEALIADINTYNDLYDWRGYTTTLQSGGRLKSIGACQGYFTDKVFMQSSGDILHLHEVYGVADEMNTYRVWNDEDVALMQKCAWACGNPNDYNRLYKVSDRAREFVAEHRNMLGKISDETFLKVMALDIAMYHNSIFGVASCNAIEIDQLSQDDLCRLMLGTKEEAMYNSSLSYGRYVYQIGDSFAVYLAAAFSLIMFVIGFIKPILSILIFISIFVSLFVFKVVLRKSTSSVYGYIVTTLLLCACNFGHALSLKLCLLFPDLGLTPAVCVILCTLIQFVYVACLASVAYVALKDWRDLGWARYQYKASQMEVGANELIAKFKYKMHIKGGNKENVKMRDTMTPNNGGGTKMYDDLTSRRERRKKRYGIG